MKISKSFKVYIHIILTFLLCQNLYADVDLSKNVVIHDKPQAIKELQFKDINLQDVYLTNKKGNIMIINFWATWCLPCKREMPSLEILAQKYPNIKIYPINMEKPNKLRTGDFYKSLGITGLDIYFDPEFNLVKTFKIRGMPTSILINKNGEEFGRVIGEIDFNDKKFIKLLKKYI
ncbi:TlpA family protein disulfide reductase [Pelagibacteraceae bacterium]|jgi:thiol-disulfide isomerase/thioredoxin|nr:TlpA family protein disulfide reductase [Pelagibacteraceae bacterium]|tara:strand:- start:7000 stop:7527 length:528 start_codon:yes stop_codon:yes gene_type:complete